jgi:hypothetical protein
MLRHRLVFQAHFVNIVAIGELMLLILFPQSNYW